MTSVWSAPCIECCQSFHFSIFQIRYWCYLIFPSDIDIIFCPPSQTISYVGSHRLDGRPVKTVPIGAFTTFLLHHFAKSHSYTADCLIYSLTLSKFWPILLSLNYFLRLNSLNLFILYHHDRHTNFYQFCSWLYKILLRLQE